MKKQTSEMWSIICRRRCRTKKNSVVVTFNTKFNGNQPVHSPDTESMHYLIKLIFLPK